MPQRNASYTVRGVPGMTGEVSWAAPSRTGKPYNLIYLVQTRLPGNSPMQVVALLMFSVGGIAVIAGVSAALYAALPGYFLECAELHGRFHGLGNEEAISKGTPTEARPDSILSGQFALSMQTAR